MPSRTNKPGSPRSSPRQKPLSKRDSGKKKQGGLINRFVIRPIGILLLASLLYLLICKWLIPPITLTQIEALFQGYPFQRDYVSWEHIPPNVKLAALASEDQLFADHEGIDWKALEKSMNSSQKGSKRHRPKGSAASTISQQTAKNVFLWQGSGLTRYIRKAPEFVYTKLIEWVWGKKRILEVYLNVIEMGPGIFGIEAAAQTYFNKTAMQLNDREAAMIIACLPNPKKFTVRPASRRVQWRSPQILRQMQLLKGDKDIRSLIY